MLRVLGGFSTRGDSVVVIGADAGWWLACGAGMGRALIGVTAPAGTATIRLAYGAAEPERGGPCRGTASLAVITTVRGHTGARRRPARLVPAACARRAARSAAGVLRPGGYLVMVVAAPESRGGHRRAGRRDRAPRIRGLLLHRHLIMTPEPGFRPAPGPARGAGQKVGTAAAGPGPLRPDGHASAAWHLLVYIKPGQVIPFPRRRTR